MTTTSLPPATPVPEAVPAPLLSPALVPRVLFPAVRACYGAALLCAPGLALGLSTGQAPSPRARCGGPDPRRAAPGPGGADALAARARRCSLAGAGVDACHAASMLALAVADPRMRRAGLTDAVAATALTAAGAVMAAGAGSPG